MNSHRRIGTTARVLGALILALVVASSGSIAGASAVVAATERPRPEKFGWLEAGGALLSLLPPSVLAALGQAQSIDDGSDNVLNVLLLGSDTRKGTAVGLTDSIMVFSLKGNVLRAASIPRDTARIPKPGGGTFKGRVNAILKKLRTQYGSNEVALQKFEEAIENLLQIPIDYHALVTFSGFHAMVDAVDPISIDYTKEIRDTKYEDDPNPNRPNGVYFPPNQTNYQLYAYQPNEPSSLCNGLWRNDTVGAINPELWCRRAMPFVRSRKGPGNSDWKRAARQQEFVYATIDDVIGSGGTQAALQPLLSIALNQRSGGQLRTNIPMTIGDIQAIWNILKNSNPGNHVVFGPKTYAKHIPGGTAYQLKLDAVRNWANTNLQ
jgi:anionic cell wall polymer biosynthesis LytR-Cps2A-Psr (LCP) family protein